MAEVLQPLRTHFNIAYKSDSLSLTLLKQPVHQRSPNISADMIKDVQMKMKSMTEIKKLQIIIMECVNFDDELLTVVAGSIPESVIQLSLDFSGCESLKGSGFLELFQKISELELQKLHLDFGEIYDINDLVMEGLSMLVQNQKHLKQFFLDLYEIDQVTQEGYLLLAQSVCHLEKLQKFHIDLSANYNLNEDSLELLFGNLPQTLIEFNFKILDTDEIGGGSFFKLSEALVKMKKLQSLALTISTFSNLNHKGTYSIFKAISSSQKLQNLLLNISNINLPDKILSFFHIPESLKALNLDLSCNTSINDKDMMNFSAKLVKSNVNRLTLNLDFCSKITEDGIEQIVEDFCEKKECLRISFPDREYSPNFIRNCLKIVSQCQTLLEFHVHSIHSETQKIQQYQQYKEKQKIKRNLFFVASLCPFQRLMKKNMMRLLVKND